MNNLLTLEYWFNVNPGALVAGGFKLLVAFTALLFIIGIIAVFLKRKKGLYRGIFNRIYDFSVANFFIAILFLFFHYENIPFFTARFWLVIWLLGIIFWAAHIAKKVRKIPEKRKELEKEMERKKYLPN